MAEAPQRPCRFFCHQCLADVSPCLPEYTCPRCETGFVEELPEESSTENSSESTSEQNPQATERADPQPLFTFPTGFGPFTLGIFDDNFDLRMRLNTENSRGTETRREQDVASRQALSAQQPQVRDVPRRQAMRQDGVPTLEGIIQQLLNGIITPTAMQNIGVGPWGLLHSSPLDYAWGANGLDAIITQLLNQFENHGPPPADRETIENLPTISVTAEHVDAGLECPVCKEDYKAEEAVRQLPCEHLFHNDCIVPWLEQHDTCPVCRESLNGQNPARDPPDRHFSSSPSSSSSTSSSSTASSPSDENSAGNS